MQLLPSPPSRVGRSVSAALLLGRLGRFVGEVDAEADAEGDGEDDEEDEEAADNAETDGVYGKPASQHLDHKYIMLRATQDLLEKWHRETDFRNPDIFGMYTFNDHFGYGIIEVVENAIKKFNTMITPQKKPYDFLAM